MELRASINLRGGRPFDTMGPRPCFYIDALWGFQLKELPTGRTRLVVSGPRKAVMTATILLKVFTVWLTILIIAIINGILRETLLIPSLGAFRALIASGIILSCCIFLLALFATPWYGRLTASQYWIIGFLWLSLTLVFEFSFGRLVQHKSWSELLQPYMFTGGNIWPIVLVITLASPWVAARLRGFL
jgi:hypothetical protein